MNKKGDISMETIVMVVVGLAVLLVVLGIFGMQTRKGNQGIEEVTTSTNEEARGQMCIGSDVKCMSGCNATYSNQVDRTCMLPGTVCCKK